MQQLVKGVVLLDQALSIKNYVNHFYFVKSVCIWSFLVRIFLYLDWIRRDTAYLSVFSQNAGKYRPEKLRIPTLLRQCLSHNSTHFRPKFSFYTPCILYPLFAEVFRMELKGNIDSRWVKFLNNYSVYSEIDTRRGSGKS